MLEVVGRGNPLSKGNFSDKSAGEKSLGLDFANLLQEAQFEQESAQAMSKASRSSASAEQRSERAARPEGDSSSLEEGEETLEKEGV